MRDRLAGSELPDSSRLPRWPVVTRMLLSGLPRRVLEGKLSVGFVEGIVLFWTLILNRSVRQAQDMVQDDCGGAVLAGANSR